MPTDECCRRQLAMVIARFAFQVASLVTSTAAQAASFALRAISSSTAWASFLRPSFFLPSER
jgi:hypothetical protein